MGKVVSPKISISMGKVVSPKISISMGFKGVSEAKLR